MTDINNWFKAAVVILVFTLLLFLLPGLAGFESSGAMFRWVKDSVGGINPSTGVDAGSNHGFLWIVAAIFFVVTIVALVYKSWWVAVGSGLFLSLALLALTPPSLIEEFRRRGGTAIGAYKLAKPNERTLGLLPPITLRPGEVSYASSNFTGTTLIVDLMAGSKLPIVRTKVGKDGEWKDGCQVEKAWWVKFRQPDSATETVTIHVTRAPAGSPITHGVPFC